MTNILSISQSLKSERNAKDALNNTAKNFFIENKGQWIPEVKYLAKVGGMNFWITKSGLVCDYYQILQNEAQAGKLDISLSPNIRQEYGIKNTTIRGQVVKTFLVDVNYDAQTKGLEKKEGYLNYFLGNDYSKHASYVPLYGNVEITDIYKNIDVKYYFDDNRIRYDFKIRAGADLTKLKLKFDGADGILVNANGELVIKTSLGEVTNGKLYSYQIEGNRQNPIICKFIKNQDGTVGFNADEYDKNKDLIIDPLIYSTFLGISGNDYGNSIALDASGRVVVAGYTSSTNFPITAGTYQEVFNGGVDIFVTKLNTSGNAIVYSTYIGGSTYDYCYSLAIDALGDVYLTGYTNSNDYPTTSSIVQQSLAGGQDAFITKVNSSGSSLIFSTYLGGAADDQSMSIAVDATGNSFITGNTTSADFPVVVGSFQTSRAGATDGFVTKLNPAGSSIIYSTYIGGREQSNKSNSIAIDLDGNAYIIGYSGSAYFPTTLGSFQPQLVGYDDCFVTKFNSTGSALIYSTYIGGHLTDNSISIALDASRNAYITGYTTSTDFPTTAGAFQTALSGGFDVFVTNLNSTGTGLIYSTYLGGSSPDYSSSMSVDLAGNYYVIGNTSSSNFPTNVKSLQKTLGGGTDSFLAKFNPAGGGLTYSTYLGGNSNDMGNSIVVDALGNAFVTGCTHSDNFLTTDGAYQTIFGGAYDAFVTKIEFPGSLPVELTSFTGKLNSECIALKWNTATESENIGFEIEKKTLNENEFFKLGFVNGAGNSSSPKNYFFNDFKLNKGSAIYRLKQIDINGDFHYSSEIEVDVSSPGCFSIGQNFPNPFNPETVIHYTLPKPADVKITVYNTLGEQIAKIVDETQPANFYEVKFNAKGFATGIYFYRVEMNPKDGGESFYTIKKMLFLK